MTMITKQKPIERDYQRGTCYMCQLCLTCNKELAFDTCECNLLEKPKSSKKDKRRIYSRVYNSSNLKSLSQLQIDKLKECDEYFGYYSDFEGSFQFNLCSKCHNRLIRLKKKNLSKQTSDSSYDSTTSLPTLKI